MATSETHRPATRPPAGHPPADSTMAGPPLEVIAPLLGGPRIDDLLRRAAARAPDRWAVRSATGDLSYAELENRAGRCAAALRAVLGGPDLVVALAMELSPAFPVAFFGIARSGNISALINPLLPADRLTQLLTGCRARAAIVPPQVYRRLVESRDRLPDLDLLVLTHRDAELGPDAAAVPTLAELMDHAPAGPPPAPDPDGRAVACLQFTSGTTGPPKAVRLTHRNLTVNAAQTAYAHQLTGSSVLFNHLPTFHLMHLTTGVTVAATHVLCTAAEPAGSLVEADRYRATHYYSLPVRLARLAADPRLPELAVPSLRAVLSGGSALPPAATTALARHFGVPVVQGYGLAETAPSVHLGNLDRPRAGSAGQLVPGAECRITHVDTGAVLPVGHKGEIRVRGPQLMKGYLGRELRQDVDADGWFRTGDVGYVDADGYLFVVDRIKDVFKCDNWLVSPTEIEAVLARHPAVADCVVFDHPDEFSGAVAHGLVVPRDGAPVELAELAGYVNERVPYYEQLRYLELVERIPRSPTGKVARRELRAQALGDRAGAPERTVGPAAPERRSR